MKKISVIVCTYNRSNSLRETLKSLNQQTFSSPLSWDVIVVDNNSNDSTKNMVQECQRTMGISIRYVFEQKQGISYARNAGINAADADIIAFMDDDQEAEPKWVESISQGFQRHSVDFLGGPIFPMWLTKPPEWLLNEKLQHHVGSLDRGSSVIVQEELAANFLHGGNIAFKRNVFSKIGGYRTDLNRGEDTEIVERAFLAGKCAAYIPSAIMHHKISAKRMSLNYFRRWWFGAGRSYVILSKKWVQLPKWLIRESILHGLKSLWNHAKGAQINAIDCERHFWYHLGMITQLYKDRKKELFISCEEVGARP